MADKYHEEVIDPGDRASLLGRDVCFGSHGNCSAVTIIPHQPDNFRGPVGFAWRPPLLREMLSSRQAGDWSMLMEVENDGAGGKPQFFTLVGTPEAFYGLGWEIITMCADDFARSGRFPVIFLNDLNVKRITDKNFHLVEALFRGYGDALRQAGLVNITGEVAIMRHSITAFCDTNSDEQLVLTWGGACIGLARRKLLINGSKIKPGQPIVAFSEPGYRCNGGTFFTNALLKLFGPDPRDIMASSEAMELVKQLTVPSQSYARTISRLNGWLPDGGMTKPFIAFTGVAHITGGGIFGKLGDILPPGVGASLSSMPEPAPVLAKFQQMTWDTDLWLSDWKAHSTLNGGCGMLCIVESEEDADRLVTEAKKDGITAQWVGRTMPSKKSEISILSQFMQHTTISSLHPQ